MVVLKAFFLGGFQLVVGDRALEPLPSRRSKALLAYLMLNPDRAHARELLAEVIGDAEVTADPRKTLRQELWTLRSAFKAGGLDPDGFLSTSGEAVTFRTREAFWLDAEAFRQEALAAKRSAGAPLTAEAAERLESAVALYRGELLLGLYDDWCLYPREVLRDLYLGALERLMLHYQDRRRWDEAITYGKRLLDGDELAEHVHRDLMRCYYAKGNRAAALRQFEICRELLARELGVEPMWETRSLYARIETEDITLSGAETASRDRRDAARPDLKTAIGELKAANQRISEVIRDIEDGERDQATPAEQSGRRDGAKKSRR